MKYLMQYAGSSRATLGIVEDSSCSEALRMATLRWT